MAFLGFFIFPETVSRYSMTLASLEGEDGVSRAGRTGEGNTFLQQMSAFSSFLFFQLGDVKNPDARESHQDFCKYNRWTVLF
jgi:hypothetical protein